MDVREKLAHILTSEPEMLKNLNVSTIKLYRLVDKLIAHGVTVREWISVKDRLPEEDGLYLIFTTQYFTPDHIDEIDHTDGIEISGYYKKYGFLSTNGMYAKHWMPLPEPPKGE